MRFAQTEETEKGVLVTQNRQKYGYWPDRTDRNTGIGQTEQKKILALDRQKREKLGIGQTERIEIWVSARPNKPEYAFLPDRTD